MFDDALIAEAARMLQAAAPEAQVLLFGSYARGEAGPDSDLDFLVIEPWSTTSSRSRSGFATPS